MNPWNNDALVIPKVVRPSTVPTWLWCNLSVRSLATGGDTYDQWANADHVTPYWPYVSAFGRNFFLFALSEGDAACSLHFRAKDKDGNTLFEASGPLMTGSYSNPPITTGLTIAGDGAWTYSYAPGASDLPPFPCINVWCDPDSGVQGTMYFGTNIQAVNCSEEEV